MGDERRGPERLDVVRAELLADGHGHVLPRPDGWREVCAGPGRCPVCVAERARMDAARTSREQQ
jgi:hypothetical protein